MRYRKLSPTGDYTFGSGQLNFLIDTPETVAQAVQTGLLLWLGEWYLNLNDGVPYPEGVIGKHSKAQADATLIAAISQMQGVVNIQNYQSVIDPNTRKYSTISGLLNTIYGETQLQVQNNANF
jgi:hypothetical protein